MERFPHHEHGLLDYATGGRTDVVSKSVPSGAYVIPADIVSALGEGNTMAGAKILDAMFPGKRKLSPKLTGGKVPIKAAGGEFIVSPERLIAKYGDLDKAHAVLDRFVVNERRKTVKKLAKLPPPKGEAG